MGEGEDQFDATAAADFIMHHELAATRRATQVKDWVQMILWGGLYGVVGLVILVAGADAGSAWFAWALVVAAAVAGVAIIAAKRGFSGPHVGRNRTINVTFLVLMVALAVTVGLLPATNRPGGLPLVWFAAIVSCTLVAVWTGVNGLIARDRILCIVAAGLLLAIVLVVLLLVTLPTDRPAAIAAVAFGVLSILSAVPIRRLEVRRWHADLS